MMTTTYKKRNNAISQIGISSFSKLIFLAVILCNFVVKNSAALDWTVMVYMCADNGMNYQSYDDLNEMKEVGSSERVKIIVQVDNLAGDIQPYGRRCVINQNQIVQLENLGEIDMADPQALIEFVRFGYRYFNAQKYLLILWDHGNGWPIGYYPSSKDKAVIYDESHNNWMGVADGELNYAVKEIKKILRKNVAILGFDACLMGMAEVAGEIAEGVDYMFASEEVLPYDGLPYNDLISYLIQNPNISAKDLAPNMVSIATNSYNNGSQGREECTFSAIDLKQFDAAHNKFSSSLTILSRYAKTPEMRQARNSVQTFAIECDSYPAGPNDDYIDLIDFLELSINAVTNANDKTECQKAIDLFKKSVVAKGYVGNYLARAKGIAVWFPDNYIAFKHQYLDYQNLQWQKNVNWLYFLNNFYGIDDIKPSSVNLIRSSIGGKNDFRLMWNKSHDLAPVRYDLLQINSIEQIFEDNCDSFSSWLNDGFVLSSLYNYPRTCFYTGIGNNVSIKLTIKDSVNLTEAGFLSFLTHYYTEENYCNNSIKRDVFYVEVSEDGNNYLPIDSFYGKNIGWTEHRYLLPQSDYLWIRFRYTTDGTYPDSGVFIDNIKIYKFSDFRRIGENLEDTFLYLFNMPQDKYYYMIQPIDSFGNIGFLSSAQEVLIENYCEPFSLPSPFFTDCNIYCDFPADQEPSLYIYTLSGELIKKFTYDDFIGNVVYWNGKNESGKEIASGLYLVLLKGKNFTRVGKIAKVK
ncbi:MAG: clostripain-related cysteine peptidase [candidate division WOR-3 bacterium]|nr:clostripain-related cysteine peptidase [candidate division WOR-3 bacterium]